MEFLGEYGLFLAKTLTLTVAVLVVMAGMALLLVRGRARSREGIEVRNLNRRFDEVANTLRAAMLPKKALRRMLKEQKRRHKVDQKSRESAAAPHRRKVFVVNFHGDLRASALSAFREEITAILTAASEEDEVLVRLESAGGLISPYGLAASQLLRVKQRNLPLTVAVDKVAASGGYLMACVADRVIAAPFAIIGSIGVVAQLPNFHRALKEHNIDFELFTAGEFKRTVTLFGENTDKARAKCQQELDEVHDLFKAHVAEHRPVVDIDSVATGEHWFGSRALELKLIDEIRTSDDYLLAAHEAADLYEIRFEGKKPFLARLAETLSASLSRAAPLGDVWLPGRPPQT